MAGNRFTYQAEHDEDGNIIGTHVLETGGYFAGKAPAEVEAIAESLYPELDPEFKRNAMQQEFYDIHFNHCLRRRLNNVQG